MLSLTHHPTRTPSELLYLDFFLCIIIISCTGNRATLQQSFSGWDLGSHRNAGEFHSRWGLGRRRAASISVGRVCTHSTSCWWTDTEPASRCTTVPVKTGRMWDKKARSHVRIMKTHPTSRGGGVNKCMSGFAQTDQLNTNTQIKALFPLRHTAHIPSHLLKL